ncbi:hypothetical protein HHI36_022571 [Cryptolaemus montrouzieri]|uniref:Uncharacterized protein n=1 Tax=Cryptolaemus montrouzieri TaxID=559131 RepID=A0ABD2N0E4_9CUCU
MFHNKFLQKKTINSLNAQMDCGTSSNASSRFVCPNDRQLALRAKLKTGWSIKTGSIGYQAPSTSNQPLRPEEQEAIIAVVKKAEDFDLSEQKRVGNLIQRLENMRRKVHGRDPNQCLLCGDSFGIFKSQKLMCSDCTRPVCQKCAVDPCGSKHCCSKDHWFCMICSETREIWKKSGAWFFKSIPKYILPEEPDNDKNSRKDKNIRIFKQEDNSGGEMKPKKNTEEHLRLQCQE